jgi:arsenate reductase
MKNVLFLCTHNSARSILSEAILNAKGGDRYRAYSAGSAPKTAPNPTGLTLLAERGHPTNQLTSKSWDVFADPGAPQLDVIVTVCDNAKGEVCPIWPGHPVAAHWGIEDPSAAADPAERKAGFECAYRQLEARIDALLALPDDLSDRELKQALNRIGAESEGATDTAKASLSA